MACDMFRQEAKADGILGGDHCEGEWNSRLEEEDGGVSTMLGLCGCLDVLLGK